MRIDEHSYRHRRADRGGRADRADLGHRSRPARHPLHHHRAEGSAGLSAQDGTRQCPHHGDLSPHGPGRPRPRRRTARRLPNGRLHRPRHEPAAAVAAALPFGGAGQARHPRHHRRHRSARALSAHLPIHAGAAAQVGGGKHARRHRPLRLRVSVAAARSGRRHGERQGSPGRSRADSRRLSGRLRRRREPGAPATRHPLARRRQHAGAAPSAVPLRRAVRAASRRQWSRPRPPLPCGGRQGHAADHAGFDPALDAAFDGGFRCGDEGAVRADRRHRGRLRDAVLQSVAAEPAARRSLPDGSGAAGRRRRSPGHSDRRTSA